MEHSLIASTSTSLLAFRQLSVIHVTLTMVYVTAMQHVQTMLVLHHVPAKQDILEMELAVQILMSALIIVTTVIATLPVLILKDLGHAHVTQAILGMVHYVPTSTSVQKTVTTVQSMPHALTTLVHSHALAMRDIQAMELFA